jgi:ATP-dependent RNA helicase HelY
MSTPAKRYAAARARQRNGAGEALNRFRDSLGFPLDGFQVEACEAVEAGQGVLVAAPTGAGKTVVGEFAVQLAVETGRKAFYTTPIKALSNQKYHDLVRRHGAEQVGLLTGDTSLNGSAKIVVMTTEVLRNMLYAGSSTLDGLGFVVMDEVHYLADRFRGAVWEEVIIHLPGHVQVVSLSATVSNAEEFGEWLAEVRGNHAVVVSEHRPVPLWQHMLVGTTLFDLFVEESSAPGGAAARVNPALLRAIGNAEHRGRAAEYPTARRARDDFGSRGRPGRGRRDGTRGRSQDPRGERHPRGAGPSGPGGSGGSGFSRGSRPGGGASRPEVIAELDRHGLLPAITFIFSRMGCEAAVGQLLGSGIRLVPERDGERIRRLVEERIEVLGDENLAVLGYYDFVEGLSRGFAAHHAGMLPLFREIVEELFTEGRIPAVFATETLALGINMPARTVVLEKLVKFNGEAHVPVTPAEYTQLTGRAGRRGIDVEGHAVVLWAPGLDPLAVGGLASTRTYPLKSSFRPTYNMAVNLVAQVGREVAREILETSFAQFQADRAVVGLAAAVRRNEEALAGYAEPMECHLGDFREYAALRRRLGEAEKAGARERAASKRAEAGVALDALKVGEVFRIGSGRRAGWAVVVEPARTGKVGWTGPVVVTEDKQRHRVAFDDVLDGLEVVTRIKVPPRFNAKSPQARRDLAVALRVAVPHGAPYRPVNAEHRSAGRGNDEADRIRRELKTHPCHACPDREEHARWAQRWWRLHKETTGLRRQVEGRTNTVARTFDRICAALTDLGYLEDGENEVTERGEGLRRLYTEKDLLAAECLRRDVWKRLDAAGLAAAVSALVHEPRRDEVDPSPRMPNDEVATAIEAMADLWGELEALESHHGLPVTGAPDAGMADMVHRWARGAGLDTVLRGQDMAAGDFVRRCKQLVDLLGQIANATADGELRRTARKAIDGVRRGVVAADRLD